MRRSPYHPDTVELIPALGALSPRGGPVQDPVLTVAPAQGGRKGRRTLMGLAQRSFVFPFHLLLDVRWPWDSCGFNTKHQSTKALPENRVVEHMVLPTVGRRAPRT